MKIYFRTMTSSTIVTSFMAVLLLTWLPMTVNGDSLADKRSDVPVETWNNQDIELERAILTEQLTPTAAGPASVEQPFMQSESNMSSDNMTHEAEQHKNASHHKSEVFGGNR